MKTLKITTTVLSLLLAFSITKTNAQDCIDFTNMNQTPADYNDINQYPVGSTFVSEGDLEIVKTNQTAVQFITDSSLACFGTVVLDVSNYSSNCKRVTFRLLEKGAFDHIAVNGDTLYSSSGFYPSYFSGTNFTFTSNTFDYFQIEGDFNEISVLGWYAEISEVCLHPCQNSYCVDFSELGTIDYNNNIWYPGGSSIYANGGLQIIKTKDTDFSFNDETNFNQYTDTSLLFHGYLTLDISNSQFACNNLSFTAQGASWIIVDGDTIMTNFPSTYSGNGFTFYFNNQNFQIIGSYSSVIIWSPTVVLSDVCLEDCSVNNNECLDFSAMSSSNDYNDNNTYPAGSTLLNAGDLKLIKTKATNYSIWDETQIASHNDTSLIWHGYLTLDVSASNYSCKNLSFQSSGLSRVIIDGDTLNQTFPSSYNGNGFTFAHSAGSFNIEGSFNEVIIWVPTGILEDVCLEDCSSNSDNCIDFSTMNPTFGHYNDDVTYPAGTVLSSTSNGLSLIKTKADSTTWTSNFDGTTINSATDTSVIFHGYLTLDVSASSYACKSLSFQTSGLSRVIIDGDTLNQVFPSSYNGNGFTFAHSAGSFNIEGSFDEVVIWVPTGILEDACLDSCSNDTCQASFTYTIDDLDVNFTNTSSDNVSTAHYLLWDFGDGNTSNANDPNHTYAQAGTYYVCLTIIDCDCPNETLVYCDSIVVDGGCNNLQKIITPNGDGKDDEMFISANSKVFNRNGHLVKEITQPTNWKGEDNEGRTLPMGQYVIYYANKEVCNVTIVR